MHGAICIIRGEGELVAHSNELAALWISYAVPIRLDGSQTRETSKIYILQAIAMYSIGMQHAALITYPTLIDTRRWEAIARTTFDENHQMSQMHLQVLRYILQWPDVD